LRPKVVEAVRQHVGIDVHCSAADAGCEEKSLALAAAGGLQYALHRVGELNTEENGRIDL